MKIVQEDQTVHFQSLTIWIKTQIKQIKIV